jgi:DNA-binding XRE family transcriptional regulator
MPASKSSHVLSVLRKNLALRQTELAKMVGCSVATITSIEVGRLKMSESLADRIVAVTGCDKAWLLANDVSEPMPKRPFFMESVETVGLQSYIYATSLLIDVFSRLFAEVRKLDKTGARDNIAACIRRELEVLDKTKKEPNALPLFSAGKMPFQYFQEYYGELPTELFNLLDLDYLIESEPAATLVADLPTDEPPKPQRRKSPNRIPASHESDGQHRSRQ